MSAPDRDGEKTHVMHALNSNGYPTAVINKNRQTPLAHSPALGQMTPRATVVIPYVWHVSEAIRRILTPLEIQACFCPHHTLRQPPVNLKDRVPLQQQVHAQKCMLARPVGHWIIGSKSTGEHLQAGTWPSLQWQSMRLKSRMSLTGKRPRWWTPTHAATRDVHLNQGISDQRPLQ